MANATAVFQPKVPISTIRSEFPAAKVMIAVGGWGDDIGFQMIARSDATIQQFARDVATMIVNTGADGVGKQELPSIKICTNFLKTSIGSIPGATAPITNRFPTQTRHTRSSLTLKCWQLFALPLEISSYQLLCPEKRVSWHAKLWLKTPAKYISDDMLAFTKETSGKIWPSVDYINVSVCVSVQYQWS